jgi:hypothetical protein
MLIVSIPQEMILRSILDDGIQSPENGLMDLVISWELTTLKAIRFYSKNFASCVRSESKTKAQQRIYLDYIRR